MEAPLIGRVVHGDAGETGMAGLSESSLIGVAANRSKAITAADQ
jgi:hypothetical protein